VAVCIEHSQSSFVGFQQPVQFSAKPQCWVFRFWRFGISTYRILGVARNNSIMGNEKGPFPFLPMM
jgi:hypothetical protein